MKDDGINLYEIKAPTVNLSNFGKLLDEDMRGDLKNYLKTYGNEKLEVDDILSIIEFNRKDSLVRAPYGQSIFNKIIKDTMPTDEFELLKFRLMKEGNKFFNKPMDRNNLDVVISINNYHAGYAAVAHNPCLTIPMGIRKNNEPAGLTFIGKSSSELLLYQIGYYFERKFPGRIPPKNSR
jgi:amidase